MSCSYFIDKLLFRGSDSRYFCQTVWSDLAVPRYISSLETLLFSFKQYFFFLQASFISSGNRTDISLDDPNFWQKWAKIAEVEIDSKSEKVESDWANARFLNGRKRRRASEQLRRTRVSNWMENSEAWSVREPRAWSGARGGFRQICWCFHRRKRSFSLVVHFLSACIASSHFWVVGIKFIMKNWFCFSDVDSCLLVSSSLVFFFLGLQESLVIDTPRVRKQTRHYNSFEDDELMEFSELDSDSEEKPCRTRRLGERSRRYLRAECFRVEKNLLIFGYTLRISPVLQVWSPFGKITLSRWR